MLYPLQRNASQKTLDGEDWKGFSMVGLSVKEMQREIQSGSGWDQSLGLSNEVLQRLGQWGLSKKLGDILNVAIHKETNMR